MKILLADDHDLIRHGLAELLRQNGFNEIEQAASLTQALEQLSLDPSIDLLLLDLYLPGAEGLQGMQNVMTQFPGVAVVLISSEEDPARIQQAIQLGASGYIPKSTPNTILLQALQLVMAGGIYLPPIVMQQPYTPPSEPELPDTLKNLSDKQLEILRLLGSGLSNKEIAERTGQALQTVKNQVSRILRVLKVDNRAAAAIIAATVK